MSLRTCPKGHQTLRPHACPICRAMRNPRHRADAAERNKQAASLRETWAIKRAARAAAAKALARLKL